MRSEEKLKLLVCLSCLLLFFAVFFYCVYEPQQQVILQKRALVRNEQVELIAVKNFLNEHSNLDAYEKEMVEKERNAENMLPENIQSSRFIHSMETFAQKYKIFLVAVKPDEIKEQDEFQSAAFSLEFYSDYFSLLHFLQEIERMQPFTCIKKLSIQSDGERLDCKMLIETYAKKEIEKAND